MITEIGIIAGEIWNFLDKNGETKLDNLIKGIEIRVEHQLAGITIPRYLAVREIILMSLGWLAREGHVLVKFEENDYKINLR